MQMIKRRNTSNSDRQERPPDYTTATQRNPFYQEQVQTNNNIDSDTEESEPEELPTVRPEQVTVAIFCALSCESVAVKYSLDAEFRCGPDSHPHARKYVYSFGRIGEHTVVIARPNKMGKVNTARLSATISQQFPNVRFALMIGIGAGIPNRRDIRLGDIAVSIPRENHPGVLEYDFGKCNKDGFAFKGCLNKPPSILLSADGQLEDDEMMNKRPFRKTLRKIIKQPGYGRPIIDTDILFDPSFHHINEGADCSECEISGQKRVVRRNPRRSPNDPVVHRGLILSGSLVVKNAEDRDLLCQGHDDAVCYEMEAAGIMDEIPCLVVRGISDYADTHKQDAWQFYAAAAAAAYGKAILCKINDQELEETKTMRETMEQIEAKVDAITQGVTDLQREVQEVHTRQSEAKYTEILEWIYPGAASSARHSAIVSARQAGTGKWFVFQAGFSRWLTSEASSRILWCYGIPGAGKSTISSVVIDYLEEKRKRDKSMQTALAYFYFDFSNKEIDTRTFARSLLKQLVFQSPKLPQGLMELFNTYSGSGKTEIEDQRIEDLLVQCASSFQTTYIVVDALDECTPELRLQVLAILERLADAGRAKVFTTSRPHPEDINEIFKDVDKIELGAKAEDIKKYIWAEIGRYQTRTPKARHIDDGLRDQIIAGLIKASNGMFLLPKLQLKFLLKQATRSRIEAALQQILNLSAFKGFHPVDETFNMMLGSIDECNRDIAEKALSWLLLTKSPLRIQDLLVALSIEPGVVALAEYQQLLQSTVLDICAGFIIVDEDSGIVRLAHETVQEYLLRKQIDVADAWTSLTKSCLGYLRFEQFSNPGFLDSLGYDDTTRLEKMKQIPFYLYTIRNWETQIAECKKDDIQEDLIAFLSQRSSVLSYCQVRKHTTTIHDLVDACRWAWFYSIGTDESPLHIAARVGHIGAIEYFLSKGISINIKHNGGHQPIWEALAHGQTDVFRLFIQKGCSPWTTWREGRRLIHYAAARGDYAIVSYLLELDSELVNIQMIDGSSPLRECAVCGHEDVARLLLDHGADWLLESSDRRTPGMISLERGWTDVFSLILRKGVSLRKPLARDMYNSGTPLHIAAVLGHEGTVKEILEFGAVDPDGFDISATDAIGNTALHNAVNTGMLSIVKMLVDSGINTSEQNEVGQTALDLAIEYGYDTIEQYLRNTINAPYTELMSTSVSTPQSSNTLIESRSKTSDDGSSSISLSDILAVYELLTQKFDTPHAAAKKILDYAEYWVEQHVKKEGTFDVDETSLPVPYLHLNLHGPSIRRMVFRTVSHDQGWSDHTQYHGTYRESCSWVEVRKTLSNQPQTSQKNMTSLLTRRVQHNIHARWESTEHINVWDMATTVDLEVLEFMSTLGAGDRVILYPKALYPGWRCYLDEAEMWVYSSPTEEQYLQTASQTRQIPKLLSNSMEWTKRTPTPTLEIDKLLLGESNSNLRGREEEEAEAEEGGNYKRRRLL
ncbi:hypothetical protein TWF730_011013 [Orbilia blumenaviensis]|uniref:Nucleoside phosphorylase domain-containing protein n=1 Tax=Orbilia blumenaviensis TaxID=1796055 RepID=A0AAV9UMT9_9PEZI